MSPNPNPNPKLPTTTGTINVDHQNEQNSHQKGSKSINGSQSTKSNGGSEEIDPLHSPAKSTIIWSNVFFTFWGHLGALYGLYLCLSGVPKWQSYLWIFILFCMTSMGETAGAHRLWSHRSYKAKLPLRVMLCVFQSMSGILSVYDWARNHRVHHKYSDTNADPHNAARGFFFAHMGWYLQKKHPQVIIQGAKNDLSDLENDAVIMFQKRHYLKLKLLMVIIVPMTIPIYFWGESPFTAFCSNALFPHILIVHGISLINSAAHLYGSKPYDKNIYPTENLLVSLCIAGEGWHNYHHSFPWDYKTSELGRYNPAAAFIRLMARIGLAYDLKSVDNDMIRARTERTGDGSHYFQTGIQAGPWGWGDKAIPQEDLKVTRNLYPSTDGKEKSL